MSRYTVGLKNRSGRIDANCGLRTVFEGLDKKVKVTDMKGIHQH